MQLSQNGQPVRQRPPGGRHGIWPVALCLAVLFGVALGRGGETARSAQESSDEYKLKTVYLYKFGTLTKWPKKAFSNPDSPFVIGILGPAPVGAALRKIAKVKTIQRRRIEIRNYKKVEEIRGCHILYMTRAVEGKTQAAVLKRLAKRNILFVGETPDFLKQGGVISFAIRQNRVRLIISETAEKREGLVVSSNIKRLSITEVVK